VLCAKERRKGGNKMMKLTKRMIFSFHGLAVDLLRFIIPQELNVAKSRGFITLLIIQSIQDNGGKIVDLHKCISSTA
jgi:hypothetical protein